MLVAAILARVGPGELVQAFRGARPGWLVGILAASVAAYAGRAWRLGTLLSPLERIPFATLFSATYVGYMAGMLVPRAGEVVRPWLVSRNRDLPAPAAFAAIVLERLLDAVTVLVLFSASLWIGGPGRGLAPEWQARLQHGGMLLALGIAATAALLATAHAHSANSVDLVRRLLRPLPERVRVAGVAASTAFLSGLAPLGVSRGLLVRLALQSVLVWTCIACGVHAASLTFGIVLPLQAAFVVLGFVLVGVTLPTPGAVGGYHAAFILALTLVYAIPAEAAAAAAFTAHAVGHASVLVIGAACLSREKLGLADLRQQSSEASPLGPRREGLVPPPPSPRDGRGSRN